MIALVRASSNCDRPILSSENILHKDHDRKYSVAKKKTLLVVSLKGLVIKMN
jgi:hypothetical protein